MDSDCFAVWRNGSGGVLLRSSLLRFRTKAKQIKKVPVRLFHFGWVIFVALACCLADSVAASETPQLLVSGLPCPGGQGEPTNSHPLVWNLRSGIDGQPCPWRIWQQPLKGGYGDVVAVTWFSECAHHAIDWDALRLDLVATNTSGDLVTNSSTIKMKAGCNFLIA